MVESMGQARMLLTSGKHALDKICDVTEDDPEAFWSPLLPSQRLDLDTL